MNANESDRTNVGAGGAGEQQISDQPKDEEEHATSWRRQVSFYDGYEARNVAAYTSHTHQGRSVGAHIS